MTEVREFMQFIKKRLKDIDKELIIQLLTHPLVKRHIPLSSTYFGEKEYEEFIAAKEKIWEEHEFGPEGYFVDNVFIGWAGVQPDEGEDFEIVVVLRPEGWGYGKQKYKELVKFGFSILKLNSVVIYFPPLRTRIKAIFKAGFIQDGERIIGGNCFIRYRLLNKRSRGRVLLFA
jgi:hypothetical protein